jgi:putative transposase
VPVIDCCTRQILGPVLEKTGRARTAGCVLKQALLARFGTLHEAPPGMHLCHDNRFVFGLRRDCVVVDDYRLQQEYIPPCTPKPNGLCGRFIKTSKKEHCWTRRSLEHARLAVKTWIHQCNPCALPAHSISKHQTHTLNHYAYPQPEQ